MKKLDLSQMENLQASGQNRQCLIAGGLAVLSTMALGVVGLIGGLAYVNSEKCFYF
ncbi:hypothetical protein MHJ94_07535 [Chryseobacterium taklimakanense]|uniref:hypothetical protein n=1 Tax=Chryseobacterium taklimakanense TaxID=536441 RepID=UPI001EF524DC|nr:hypothetical protein [Chryseobacterium taklimakanense]MCG7281149.1 hypothetical protein [Chryseobacterium taklimakanense]